MNADGTTTPDPLIAVILDISEQLRAGDLRAYVSLLDQLRVPDAQMLFSDRELDLIRLSSWAGGDSSKS